jgi:hypothetical protein
MPENRLRTWCVVSLLSSFFALNLLAQRKVFVIRGELVADAPLVRVNDYEIEILSPGDRFGGGRVPVASDGTFFIRDVESGVSQLRVIDARGEIVHQEYVTLQEGLVISIRLQTAGGSRAPAGKVSARELAHPTPLRAVKEYMNAKKAVAAGDLDKAIAHFLKAAEIHPQFVEAWNDLGVAYMNEKRVPEAVAAFEKAAAIEPDSKVVSGNLRVASTVMKRALKP